MTAAVRCFAYSGIRAVTWASNNQLATNGVFVFAEPPLACQAITASGSAQSTTTALSPAGVSVLRVEVQKGSVVHYRVSNANGTPTAATTNDATLEGKDSIDWGPGYTISFILAGNEA